jgi:hypothetical protein
MAGPPGRKPNPSNPRERGEQGLGRKPCGAGRVGAAPGRDAWRGRPRIRPTPRIFGSSRDAGEFRFMRRRHAAARDRGRDVRWRAVVWRALDGMRR